MILYFIIGFIISCLIYILGKKGYLSEYMYYSYNYHTIDPSEKQAFSRKRYGSSTWFDMDQIYWAYIQLGIYLLIWPLVISFIVITLILSKIIKPKK